MEENELIRIYRSSASTQGNGANALWCTVPRHLQRRCIRNISVVYACYTPEKLDFRRAKRKQNRKEKKRRETKENKSETVVTNMRSGRRTSAEGTRLLFAGTISPTYLTERTLETKRFVLFSFCFLSHLLSSAFISLSLLFTGNHVNQDPPCTPKPIYTPIFTHHMRS